MGREIRHIKENASLQEKLPELRFATNDETIIKKKTKADIF